jgi:P27 family predicted phage terminase small subunit
MRRIPTHLKLIRGNPGKRAIPPEPEPIQPPKMPEAPPFLTGYAADEWYRVGPELHRLGLLTVLDLGVFSAYCEAYKRWRTAEEVLATMAAKDAVTGGLLVKCADGNAGANPLVRIAAHAARDMVSFAGEFGMSPLARARIGAGASYEPPPGGKFDGLLG